MHTHSSEAANSCPGAATAQRGLPGRNLFWQAERSSFPARSEQPREILQLWVKLNHCQAAPFHWSSPSSPFPTLSCTPATWSCSSSLGVLHSPGNIALFGLARAVLLSDSLPRRVFTPWFGKVTTGSHTRSGLGFTQDPGTYRSDLLPRVTPTSPSHASHSLLLQHGHAAQTAARYYSRVAWIPLNACQSAQRAESELFKLHLLKDPWCLFLLFVFSNSLKS